MDTKDITKGKQSGIDFLNSDDCPNIKNGMGLTQIQLYVIAGILEAYHQSQSTQMRDRIVELEGEKDKLYSENDMKKIVKWINVRCSEPVDALGQYPFQGKLYDLDSIFEIYKRDYYEKL